MMNTKIAVTFLLSSRYGTCPSSCPGGLTSSSGSGSGVSGQGEACNSGNTWTTACGQVRFLLGFSNMSQFHPELHMLSQRLSCLLSMCSNLSDRYQVRAKEKSCSVSKKKEETSFSVLTNWIHTRFRSCCWITLHLSFQMGWGNIYSLQFVVRKC